jgi:hypothetical protein
VEFIKAQPPCNPGKAFTQEVDRLINDRFLNLPHKAKMIPHSVAFRIVTQRGFLELWNNQSDSEDCPLELACRLLEQHDSLRAAEELIFAWWKKHDLDVEVFGINTIMAEADKLTCDKRAAWRNRKESENEMRRPKTKDMILEYMKAKGSGTPAQIANGLGFDRKPITKQLERMFKTAVPLVDRDDHGVYRLVERIFSGNVRGLTDGWWKE